MDDYVIELNKISCKAGYRYLLKDIDWQVKSGERWIVFGMNGSGKTTLLSIIAGFMHYTQGTIKLFNEPFCDDNILRIRKKIGWVSSSFFDKYYTKESILHIVLSGKHGTLGLSEDLTLDDVCLAKDLLIELQLSDKINRPFSMLSKGERQNVLIARALYSNPDILILDEPCTGLDVYNRSYLFNTIEKLSKRKALTVIYVTHYVEEIMPLFQKTLLLKNGHVFAKGETASLFNNEIMSELLGYPVKIGKEQNGGYHIQVETDSKLDKLLKCGDIK